MHDFRQKLKLKRKPRSATLPSVKMKHTFRIKAHDSKDKLLFFKVRTKKKMATVKRVATLRGFTPDRITK